MKGKLFCRQQRQKRLEFSEEGRLVGPKCLYKYIIEKTAGFGYRHLIKKATKLVLWENILLQTFSLSYGYTLCPFWSGIGCGFRGNYGVYERIYRFNSK